MNGKIEQWGLSQRTQDDYLTVNLYIHLNNYVANWTIRRDDNPMDNVYGRVMQTTNITSQSFKIFDVLIKSDAIVSWKVTGY